MKKLILLAALLVSIPLSAQVVIVPKGGGVTPNSCSASNFATSIAGDGTLTCAVPTGATVNKSIGITIDGQGSVISTGTKGFVSVPYTCTIGGVKLLSTDSAVTSGSIVIDLWKVAYASYPPTVTNTITASDLPTLSSATSYSDSALTGWTTAVTAGDVIAFHVNSASTVTKVSLFLSCM